MNKMNKKSQIKEINIDNILKRTSYSEKTNEVVQSILKGKFYFFRGLDEVEFPNGIDWDYQHKNSASTYQLYMHSLELISHLCNYYEVKKDLKVLEKAYEILLDWFEYNKNKKVSKFCWYSHTVSSRSLTIVYFYLLANKTLNIDEELIYKYLVKHAEFLFLDKNYVKNNHGIMMDRSLIELSLVLDHPQQKRWRDKAIFRIKEAFYRDFSSKGVHLENSPEYHRMVRTLFSSTERFLKKNKISLGSEFNKKVERTGRYLQYIVKPDGFFPIIGDTDLRKVDVTKRFDDFVDTEAGIAILQSKDKKSPKNSTWLSFICGYGSKTHKHKDDLSFNLFYKGKDIFIDSGKYNYNESDKIRKYLRSTSAHNTLSIENADYDVNNPLLHRELIKVTDYHINSYYTLIKGRNFAYDGLKVTRTIIFFKPDIIIIFDELKGDKNNTHYQNFNLAPHVEVIEKDDNYSLLKSEDEIIEVRQILENCRLNSYRGDMETPRGIISEKFGEVTENSQLEYYQQGENSIFLTLIKMGKNNKRIKSISYNQEKNILTIDIDNNSFTIIP